MADKVEISAIHLGTVGDHVIVAVEIDGNWIEVIRERKDNAYSHIVEADTIDRLSFVASSEQVRRALRGQLGRH